MTISKEWATAINAINISQPNATTCQAACIAMAVGDRDVMKVRRALLSHGPAGSPLVMERVIRGYGVPYIYEANASLLNCYDWLKRGELLVTHGWFTGSGHVICLDGLRQLPNGRHQLNVKDPWSEFNANTWRYDKGVDFYDGFYSDLLVYATCVAGSGRDDAQRIYRAGAIDNSRRGMWVHRFLVP